MKIIKFILLVFVAFGFVACAPSYNIEPKYENGALSIQDLEIPNMKFHNTKNHSYKDNLTLVTNYLSNARVNNNNICKEIKVIKETSGTKFYISNTLADYFRIDVDEGRAIYCDETKISNITFGISEGTGKYAGEKVYYISTGKNHKHWCGYESTLGILVDNERCFNKILNHFKYKAKENGIEIQKIKYEGK